MRHFVESTEVSSDHLVFLCGPNTELVLETALDQLRAVSADERPVIIEQCLAGIGHLSDLLKDAASYLPAYDQRAYSLVRSLMSQFRGWSAKLHAAESQISVGPAF
jgi:hypothetical protein